MNCVVNLTDLPDHLLVALLRALDTQSRLNLSATCSTLRELSFYPTVWQNFELLMKSRRCQEECKANESVSIFFEKVVENSIKRVVWELNNCYLPTLLKLCSRNSHITSLSIYDSKFSDDNLKMVCERLRFLNHIGIRGSTALTGEGLVALKDLSCLSSLG